MPVEKEKKTRDRARPLKVYVSSEERQIIKESAKTTRLSISDYLRTLGLGHTPKNIFDQDAVIAFVKAHADQGRLGGLLKLWLSSKANEGASVGEVRHLLGQIEQLQKALQKIVSGL